MLVVIAVFRKFSLFRFKRTMPLSGEESSTIRSKRIALNANKNVRSANVKIGISRI
jgi:hypothetical protein